MLESFCAAANFRGFLERPDCPPVLKESAKILGQCTGKESAIMTEIRTLELDDNLNDMVRQASADPRKQRPLSERVHSQLHAMDEHLRKEINNWSLPNSAFFHERHTIGGTQYTTHNTLQRDSFVFFQPRDTDGIVPGLIQDIFSVPVQLLKLGKPSYFQHIFFLVIQRYLPLKTPRADDPFEEYEDSGFQLWSDKLADEPDVVLETQWICHSIQRTWAPGAMVMKPLDRVSIL
jgi:hypothetical protein